MAMIPKWPSDLFEDDFRQSNRPPFGTANAHVLAIVVKRDGAKQVDLILIAPNVRGIRQRHRRQDAIHEDEQRDIVVAEERLPMGQAVDVFLRGPAFPDIARPFGGSAGKLPPLDIDEQLGAGRAEHDEIEVLHRHIAEHRAPRLIDGDVTKPLFREERFECRFVGVAAVHGDTHLGQMFSRNACGVGHSPGEHAVGVAAKRADP